MIFGRWVPKQVDYGLLPAVRSCRQVCHRRCYLTLLNLGFIYLQPNPPHERDFRLGVKGATVAGVVLDKDKKLVLIQ